VIDFIKGQTDFMLFVCGLSFAVISVHAISLYRTGQRGITWQHFAVFAFSQSLVELVGLIMGVFPMRPQLMLGVHILGALSALALLEFVRASTQSLRSSRIGYAINSVVALIALASIFAFQDMVGHVIFIVLSGGAPLAAGVALLAAGKKRRSVELGRLTLVAGLLAAYGLSSAAGLFAAAAGGSGPLIMYSGSSASLLLLVRALVLFSLMLVLGGYNLDLHERLSSRRVLAGAVGLRAFLGVLLVVALVSIWGVTLAAGQQGEKWLLSRLAERAVIASVELDGDEVEALAGDPRDTHSNDFLSIQDKLTRVLEVSEDLTYAYLMTMRDGEAVILVEGVPVDDAPRAPSTVCSEASPELISALTTGEAFVEGPLEDQRGIWYSAFSVVDTGDSGSVVLLGFDEPASRVESAVAGYRLASIFIAMVMSSIVIGFYVGLQATRAMTAQISASEEGFRAVFDNVPEAIMITDSGGRIVSVNPHVGDWLGYSEADLIGVTMDRLVVGDSEELGACFTGVLAGEQLSHSERVYRRADGSTTEVEVTAVPIEYSGDRGALFLARDVSSRNQAERLAREQSEFASLIVKLTSAFVDVGASRIDLELQLALEALGEYVKADHVYIYSFSEDGSTMRNTHEWIPVDRRSRMELMQGVRTKDYAWLTEPLLRQEDLYIRDVETDPDILKGTRKFLLGIETRSLLVVPMVDRGRVTGFMGFDSRQSRIDWSANQVVLLKIVADVISSAQRRAKYEADLSVLSRASEQSPLAMLITDPNGAIEFVNPAFTELTGYALNEVLGENPRILKTDLTAPGTHEEMWRTVLDGETWQGTYVNKRKDGSHFWASASISAVRREDGHITHLVGLQEDVTALRKAEEELLRAKNKAEAANSAKSEFLSTMSHEIRTPMNAIIGMGELLDDTPLSSQQRRYVEVFTNAGDALLSLINNILDLSKIEAERFDIEETGFDLYDLVEQVAAVMAIRANETGVEMMDRVAPDVPTWVSGDPDRLRQVLVNLMGNAIKFTEEGHVLLEVTLDESGEAPVHRFEVSDTGIGIAPDKLGRVFERFTQADSSTTRRFGGTGLGLTISQRLVELMGGEIGVESVEDQGATFWFTLPLKPLSTDEVVPVARVEHFAGVRMLVVDDNEHNRLILREMLSAWGARVTEARDGTEALAAFGEVEKEHDPYRILLLDYRMPDMDGTELLERIRSLPTGTDIPALMLSSDVRGPDESRVKEIGLLDYLMKPVRRVDLRSAVADALSISQRDPGTKTLETDGQEVAQGASAMRILVAEDSEDNRFLLEAYLKKTPHSAIMVENGQQAVDTYLSAEEPFDLVLMDMQMPILDGYEATRDIRRIEAQEGRPRMPIVALTAYALKEEADRSIEAGCDEHLTKPIKKKVLLDALRRYASDIYVEGDEDGE
jgi:two-component system sensor histidine kinase/response regulator